MIYRMLGLPQEDIATFYKLTVAQIITYPTMDNAADASAKLGRYSNPCSRSDAPTRVRTW